MFSRKYVFYCLNVYNYKFFYNNLLSNNLLSYINFLFSLSFSSITLLNLLSTYSPIITLILSMFVYFFIFSNSKNFSYPLSLNLYNIPDLYDMCCVLLFLFNKLLPLWLLWYLFVNKLALGLDILYLLLLLLTFSFNYLYNTFIFAYICIAFTNVV